MINYQKEMEKVLKQAEGTRPTLLLHVCCGPCSTYVLSYLCAHFDITADFYNPNIGPPEEYAHRHAEFLRLLDEMPETGEAGIATTKDDYDPEAFYAAVRGLEGEKEGGARCEVCFRMRLTHAAKEAKAMGADYFTTTLSISPHKDAQLLNRLGEEIGEAYGVRYLVSDFKKRDGYKQSIALSKQYNLYRQDYCGCVFSKQEAKAWSDAHRDEG